MNVLRIGVYPSCFYVSEPPAPLFGIRLHPFQMKTILIEGGSITLQVRENRIGKEKYRANRITKCPANDRTYETTEEDSIPVAGSHGCSIRAHHRAAARGKRIRKL